MSITPSPAEWLRDFVLALADVNQAAHAATGPERERLYQQKNDMLSAATIILPPPLLTVRYQPRGGRSPLLFAFNGPGFGQAFHTPGPEHLTPTARAIVNQILPRAEGF
jgi:hypothetical protein